MSTDSPDNPYVLGESHPNTKDYATFETKPSVPKYTGGGYEHFRSCEHRPETPGDSSEDVYCSVHRLTAVVECYDVDEPLEGILDDLRGKDVHHTTGVPWCNFGESPNFDEPGLEILGHGEHAEITQTQRRAWAADKKQQVETAESMPVDTDQIHCDRCGEESDTLTECDAWPDEQRCIECATETADGHEIIL